MAEKESRITVDVRDKTGKSVGKVEFDPSELAPRISKQLLHDVVIMYLANQRAGTHSTLRRGEVAGSTKKLFRQKGTGRARQGSTRSPQWIGGGVALGPKPRSYAQKTPKKMIQLALRAALSDRAAEGLAGHVQH